MVFIEFLEFLCRVAYVATFTIRKDQGEDSDSDDFVYSSYNKKYLFGLEDVKPYKTFLRNLKNFLVHITQLIKKVASPTDFLQPLKSKEHAGYMSPGINRKRSTVE